MQAPPPGQTPPPPPYGRQTQPPPPGSGPVETGSSHRHERWRDSGPDAPEWQAWTWTSSARPVPWFGGLLLVLGVGLLIEQLVPELTFGSLLILGLGGAFAIAWLIGRIKGATVPALVLLGWGLARVGGELGYLTGDGWSLLFVGIGLLIAWALGRVQDARRDWALVLGAILAVIGLADAVDSLPFTFDAAIVIPVLLIGAGLWLIWRRGLPTG